MRCRGSRRLLRARAARARRHGHPAQLEAGARAARHRVLRRRARGLRRARRLAPPTWATPASARAKPPPHPPPGGGRVQGRGSRR
jgi:hypothetical protein